MQEVGAEKAIGGLTIVIGHHMKRILLTNGTKHTELSHASLSSRAVYKLSSQPCLTTHHHFTLGSVFTVKTCSILALKLSNAADCNASSNKGPFFIVYR